MASKTQNLGRVTRPFSIGYAYAQTQHYRDAVAAQAAEADPFDAIQLPEPEATPEIPAPAAPVRTTSTATDAQVDYILSLTKRNLGEATDEVLEAAEAHARGLSTREASKLIDTLKAIPAAPKKAATATVTEGMYRDPATGDIFKVQAAVHGSGQLYAKKLVALEEPRVKGKKTYSHEFAYVAGLIGRIRPEWKMSKEEAQEWGRLYGSCCKCGAVLTDEQSIANGIGPVCGGRW